MSTSVDDFADLAPFDVPMLHPARTLLEKSLRVNNFVLDGARRSTTRGPHRTPVLRHLGAPGRDDQVVTFLQDRVTASAVLADCFRVSEDFAPDLPPPTGGFAACEAFNPDWDHASQLRVEHDSAIRDLYYGVTPPPSYDDVIVRIKSNANLLDLLD